MRFYHSRSESINRPASRSDSAAYGVGSGVGTLGSGAGIGSLKFSGLGGGGGFVRVMLDLVGGVAVIAVGGLGDHRVAIAMAHLGRWYRRR